MRIIKTHNINCVQNAQI